MSEYIASVEGLFAEQGTTSKEFGFNSFEEIEKALQDTTILVGTRHTLFSTEGSVDLLPNALALEKFFAWASED